MFHRVISYYQKKSVVSGGPATEVADTYPHRIHVGGSADVTDLKIENLTDSVIELWVHDTEDDPGSNSLHPQLRLRADPQATSQLPVGAERFHNGIWINLVAGDSEGRVSLTAALPKGTIVSTVGFRNRERTAVSN